MNGVKSPKIVVVALGRDDGECPKYGGKPAGEFVGSSNVSGEDGDNVFARGVDVDDGGIRVLGLDAGGDGPDTDAESADEDESFITGKIGGDKGRGRVDGGSGVFLTFARIE